MKEFKKYYIGLLSLGVLVIGLTGYVISQVAVNKADQETYKYAQGIAEKVNSYMLSQSTVPSSLYDMGITDVKSSVRYEKLSDEEFKFCVTYKTKSGNYDLSVTGVAFGAISSYSGYDLGYTDSSIYLDMAHKKGENCNNVKPFQYGGGGIYEPATKIMSDDSSSIDMSTLEDESQLEDDATLQ